MFLSDIRGIFFIVSQRFIEEAFPKIEKYFRFFFISKNTLKLN